ncbi:MAG: DUF692 domain-containing protein [Steroidobacteraceae bacterium]
MTPTAGLGFKPEHFAEAMSCPAAGMWFEVHAENYMVAGGPKLAMLEALRSRHPLSIHGVGLSLAADADPDPRSLAALNVVVDRFRPFVVSEHLAWSSWAGAHLPDLLPFPRNQESLLRMVRNVDITQQALGRSILIENPSAYLPLAHEISEAEFLSDLARRTGCGLLVDVNNAYVSASNLGGDAGAFLAALPAEAIGEIHLAGHSPDAGVPDSGLLIDTHAAPVCDVVWQLYSDLLARMGPRPTLIERDDNVPAFDVLMGERDHAASLLAAVVSEGRPHAIAC